MRPASQFVTRMSRDATGAVLPLAAVGIVVGMVIVGAAVDMGRNYLAREQLQAACDAGVLAGRRTVTTRGFDNASKNAATAYFNTNFSDDTQGTRDTKFDPVSSDNGNTITATASTVLDTLIMRAFGQTSFAISVTCGSSMGVGNADVMLVLDTTGSMDTALSRRQTRIQALRAAVKNFYTTLSGATAGTNARVRYGFVPYSSTVNVGRLLDANYIVDNWTYQSRMPFYLDYAQTSKTRTTDTYSNETTVSSDRVASGFTRQSDCLKGYSSDADFSDYRQPGTASTVRPTAGGVGSTAGTSTTSTPQAQRKTVYQCVSYSSNRNTYYALNRNVIERIKTTTDTYSIPYVNVPSSDTVFDHWEYKQVPYRTDRFKQFLPTTTYTGTGGAAVSSTWSGCIEERETSRSANFSYSALSGYSPSAALDINIDARPGTDDGGKWRPMWTQVAYSRAGEAISTFTRDTTTTGYPMAEYCPKAAQGLQEMTKSSFDTYADSLTAIGGTYLDIGMIWGGRLLSPDGIFSSVVNDPPSNGGEVSRHVIFMTDGEMDTAYHVQTAWGIEWFDRRVTTDGSTGDDARHTQRFLATCEAIKDKGIRVWVVAFTSSLSDDLKTCASDSSSFTANSATELNNAFQEIAKQVGELRVVE